MTEQQFRSIRLPLQPLLKTPDKTLPIILNYVNNMNIKVTYAYQFIRLFLLNQFHTGQQLQTIDPKFCEHVLSVITHPDKKRKIGTQFHELKMFYNEHFKALIPVQQTIEPDSASTIAQYLSIEMNTCLHNNIKIHFIARLKKIITFLLKSKEEFKDLSKGQISRGAALIINALWNKDKSELKPSLHGIYDFCLSNFIPVEPYQECLQYDIEANTQRYFLPTFKMNQYREQNGLKPFQPLCLRKSGVPKNIPIDTKALIYMFDLTKVSQYKTSGLLLENYKKNEILQEVLWDHLFKTNKKVFKTKDKYQFYYYIVTDGVGCSLKFINREYLPVKEKRYKSGKTDEDKALFKRFNNKSAKKQAKKQVKNQESKMVSDLSTEQKKHLLTKNLVGCDPGQFNIIQLVDNQGHHLKYTRSQRYKEIYLSQNKKTRLKMLRSDNIQTYEKDLNVCKSKTMVFDDFKTYIKTKNQVWLTTRPHYEQLSYRKMNLRQFIHTKKSEARLIKNIKQTFGSDATILYGNWSRKTHMKYNAPVPGKGIKSLISKHFDVVTVDEFKSSSVCFYNQKQLKNNKISGKSLHRCLVCEQCRSLKNGSEVRRFINRDIMGALNIRMLGEADLNNQMRPEAYKRASGQREKAVDPFDEPRALPIETPLTKIKLKIPSIKRRVKVI